MNEYEIAILCGVAIAALWVLAYVLCWAGQRAWAWVDDSEPDSVNLITKYFAIRAGYKYEGKFWKWRDPSGSGTDFIKLEHKDLIMAYSTLIPIFAVICFKFYAVFLVILVACGLAWVARFSRRHKKLFDKHIKDKDAHN